MTDDHRPPQGQLGNYWIDEEMDYDGEMRLFTEDGTADRYVVRYANEGVKQQLADLEADTRVRLRLDYCSDLGNVDMYEVTEFQREGWL